MIEIQQTYENRLEELEDSVAPKHAIKEQEELNDADNALSGFRQDSGRRYSDSPHSLFQDASFGALRMHFYGVESAAPGVNALAISIPSRELHRCFNQSSVAFSSVTRDCQC